jgi:ethanolamine transporter EutH
MGFGLWGKIKDGLKKVGGGLIGGLVDKVVPWAGKIVDKVAPIAETVGGVVGMFNPKIGAAISTGTDLARELTKGDTAKDLIKNSWLGKLGF